MIKKIRNKLLLFFKGMAMGAADVVPGVSGGTIAFITGIYEKLITSLNNINMETARLCFRGRWKEMFAKVNGFFLITLMLGILTAVFTLARLIKYLLENHPVFIWSFFLGLIFASAWVVSRKVKKWNYLVIIFLVAGIIIAYAITNSQIVKTPDTLPYTFLAGTIAIIAMILPGISGSFILVILDKYHHIIDCVSSVSTFVKTGLTGLFNGNTRIISKAYENTEFLTLLVFFAGTITGLLVFSKILHWLFKKYHDLTIALLTGFLLGSLNKVWPWKNTISYYTGSHEEKKPLVEENVLPPDLNKEVLISIGLIITGFAIVFLIDKIFKDQKGESI